MLSCTVVQKVRTYTSNLLAKGICQKDVYCIM